MTMPSDQPAYDQPAYDQPAYDQPAYDQPAYDQPAYDQPGAAGYPAQPADGMPAAPPADNAMTVSREQVTREVTWVRTGGVRLRRRIVSETRTVTVEVQVRREELEIDSDGVEWAANGVGVGVLPGDTPAPPPSAVLPIVVVLREEVPQVVMALRAYERVTATVVPVTEQRAVSVQLSHEEVSLEEAAPQAAAAYPPAAPTGYTTS